MGMFSDAKAAIDVQRIKTGGTAKLSISQITCLIVNMSDAKKNLPEDQFEAVYSLYRQLRKCKSKIQMDIDEYYRVSGQIVLMFNHISPYEEYSGGNPIETAFLLSAVESLCEDDKDTAAKIIDQIENNSNPTKKNIKSVFPIVAIVLSALLCVSLSLKLQNQMQENERLASELSSAEKKAQGFRQSVEQRDSRISELTEEKMEMFRELVFWESTAVIVTKSGEKYHTYGCPTILNSDSFWIYNREAAISRGYEPCSVCDPPR